MNSVNWRVIIFLFVMSTDIPSTSMQISQNLDKCYRIYLLDLISDRPTKIRILLWFSASASMPPMFTTRENLSEFAGSLSFLSLCLQNNVCTWHTSVDRCSSRVLLLHFLPLFAQRLRAIIGTNTRCITHIWAHTLKHKRQVHVSARRRLPLMYTHARAPACKHTIASFSLTLRPLCVFFFIFQVFWGPSQLAASLKGVTLRGKSKKTNRWVPQPLVKPPFTLYPPPPFIYQISPQKQDCALSWANTRPSGINSGRTISPNLAHTVSLPHKGPLLQTWTGMYL